MSPDSLITYATVSGRKNKFGAVEADKTRCASLLWQLLFGLWKKPIVSYVKWEQEYLVFDVSVNLKRNV